MPAVRVEADALSDERYEELARLAGLADADHARGKMLRVWSQCTAEQTHTLSKNTIIRIIGDRGDQALIEARLAENVCCHLLRVRGTRGRIEWLETLRTNGRYGKRGGRPKKNPTGFQSENPSGLENKTPLLCSDLLGSALHDPKTPVVPKGSRGRPKKPKPTEPTDAELASVRTVLAKLGARNGVSYSGSQEHTRLIVGRLRDGFTEMDLRKVIAYCAEQWRDSKMAAYLRPETLFGPTTITRYADAARSWFDSLPGEEREQ